MPLPASGTYLDAPDRCRLLRDVKIRFGDIDSKPGIGSLVIGSMDAAGTSYMARVRNDRLYE